jgi:hypothetical protein
LRGWTQEDCEFEASLGYIVRPHLEDAVKRPAWTKSLQDSTNGWVWWCVFVIPAIWGSTKRRIVIQVNLGIKQDPISKITNVKRTDEVAQVVEHLPRKHKAPEFNPQYHKNKTNNCRETLEHQ